MEKVKQVVRLDTSPRELARLRAWIMAERGLYLYAKKEDRERQAREVEPLLL